MRTQLLCSLLLALPALAQDRVIRLPRDPQISPDGQQIAFSWRGDVWTAAVAGGVARRLTTHPASDSTPMWHPDQSRLAFVSTRDGSSQIYTVAVTGGLPTQVTRDSQRKALFGYSHDGSRLLVGITTDRGFHYSESRRLFAIDPAGSVPQQMLLDVGLQQAALSADGKQLLFVRGRPMWSRKGYVGPQAAQLWHADLRQDEPTLTRLDRDRPGFQNIAEYSPIWAPEGNRYYFLSDPDGTYDLYARSLGQQQSQRITRVGKTDRSDDGLAFPSLSRDGTTMLARRRFDLVRIDTTSGALQPIELHAGGDDHAVALERRTVGNASDVAFTADGKQMAFVAGEDIWVMDRILKEPRRVTNTPHAESGLVFSEDGTHLFFVSDSGGEADIWAATCQQDDGIWWLANDFALRQVTDDREVEGELTRSPKGGHIAFLKGNDVFVMDDDGSDARLVVDAWSRPDFTWSPDGRWLCYATQDSDYNSDVWLVPLDGTRKPHNLSRHPDYDGQPAWSGDGRRIAFVSRRDGEESDVYYVNLTRDIEEQTSRDRQLEKALAAMKKGRNNKAKGPQKGDGQKGDGTKGDAKTAAAAATAANADKPKDKDLVTIDFDGLQDRRHRISIRNSREGGLIWSPDGKKLLFSATVGAQSGLYEVEFPKLGAPKRVAASGLRDARWHKQGNEIVGRLGGTPAVLKGGSKLETFGFSVRQQRDWRAVRQISFDQGWRAMRDRFYDPSMNNRDWEAIRRKYRPVAAQCLGQAEFSELMNMMLGELNASHMGHRGGTDALPDVSRRNAWSPRTLHLGLRFQQQRPQQA